MNPYGQPQTFELDYQQINRLFDLLDKELKKPERKEELECLVALRNDLYRCLD